jgi:uncharacterized delta-60 repeat protein
VNGLASSAVGAGQDTGKAVAIQPDGKIVVAGSVYIGSNLDFGVVRYNPDGSLDTSFHFDGKLITPVGAGDDFCNAIALQAGKIIVAGGANTDFAVVRYNSDGSLDTSFDSDGKTITPVGNKYDIANAVAVQTDGKIVVAGYATTGANRDFGVVRYHPDGSLDSSFDYDGKTITPIGGSADEGNAVVIQPDGKIIVAGSSFVSANNTDFAVVRYHPDGSLDDSYRVGGKVVVNVSNGRNDIGSGIALDSFGNAIVAGESGELFGAIRILGGDPPMMAATIISRKAINTDDRGILHTPARN